MKFNYFEECGPEYSGPNCTILCSYPTYGDECQGICACDKKTCDISTGCRIPRTGFLFQDNDKIIPIAIVHCL